MLFLYDYQKENSICEGKTEIQEKDDSNVRFIGDKVTNTLHDKLCLKVSDISKNNLILLNELDKNMLLCKSCQRKVFIREAIKDDENFSWYMNLFDTANYRTSELKGFIYMKGVKLYRISDIELQIKYKEDTWIASCIKRNKYKLFHNSYVFTSMYDRRIIPGKFHIQKKDPMRLRDLLRYIAMYDWESHFNN